MFDVDVSRSRLREASVKTKGERNVVSSSLEGPRGLLTVPQLGRGVDVSTTRHQPVEHELCAFQSHGCYDFRDKSS
jgi:hypothetical protein